jgi:hypothetical protein
MTGETRPPKEAKRSSGPFRVANAASLGERPDNVVRLPARKPVVGIHADHRPNDYRFARDQREAGIENLEWEERLPPFRPWMFWLAVAGSWAVFGGAIWWSMALFVFAK